MAQFLQIGDKAVNMDLVAVVTFGTDKQGMGGELRRVISLYPAEGEDTLAIFWGENAERFMAWWNEHAPLYKT